MNGIREEHIVKFESLSEYTDYLETDGISFTTHHVQRVSNYIHRHDYYEMEYISSGEGVQWINGYTHYVKKGDVIFFRLHDYHDCYSLHGLEIVNCCFKKEVMPNPKALEEDRLGATVVHLTDEAQIEFETLLYLLRDECKYKKEYSREAAQHYLQILLIFLRRIGYMRYSGENHWEELFMYLSENYATVTLEEAMRMVYLSKSYFCRSFREKTGVSFLEYVSNLRIHAACTLLTQTELSIGEIWRNVGFPQAKQFNHCFLEKVSCTPKEYRKKHSDCEL